MLISHGFSCRTVDYSIRFIREFENHDEFSQLENYFLTGFCDDQHIEGLAKDLIERYVLELCALDPRYVAISVFTYQSRTAAVLFSEALRQHGPGIKIVLGGQGLSNGINGRMEFADNLLKDGKIDFFIKSEGETALVKLLQKEITWPGINVDSFNQTKNIDSLPSPDYDDYDFSQYDQPVSLPITGSRGCVRKCTFCDIHQHWKYTYRTGENIANEMIALSQKYGIKKFHFTDSLINGNIREFRNMIKILSNHNLQNPQDRISWGGQFIVHSKSVTKDEAYWKNLSDAGAENLSLGIESGSESVRDHMEKNFSNQDLDHTMNMFEKYNITCRFLLIFGYPTETHDDFVETLMMFRRYQHLAKKIIVDLEFGSTLAILPGSPLYQRAHDLEIEMDKHENNWVAFNNPELTLEERIRRRNYAKNYAQKLGYATNNNNDNFIQDYLVSNLETFNKRTKIRKMIKIKQISQLVS